MQEAFTTYVLRFSEFFNFLQIIISSRSESLALNSFNIFQRIHSIQTQNIPLNWESIASIFLIYIIHNFREILRVSAIFSHSSR